MNKISEIKNERERVEIHYEDGSRVLIPEHELMKIKDQGTSRISRVRDMVNAVVVPA